jgi:hypothetical protein
MPHHYKYPFDRPPLFQVPGTPRLFAIILGFSPPSANHKPLASRFPFLQYFYLPSIKVTSSNRWLDGAPSVLPNPAVPKLAVWEFGIPMLHFQELLVHSASPASRGFLIRITDKSEDHCVIIVCILIRTFFTLAFVANYVMARQDERARVYNWRWHSQRRRALLGTYNTIA